MGMDGGFASWLQTDKFRANCQYVGQIDHHFMLQCLELCSCHDFPQQLSIGWPMKTAHIIFFTASGLWPWDVLPTPFKATLVQHSDDFGLSFDSKTHDSNLNANVFVLDESQKIQDVRQGRWLHVGSRVAEMDITRPEAMLMLLCRNGSSLAADLIIIRSVANIIHM